MEDQSKSTPQWTLDVTIHHGSGYQHLIQGRVLGRRGSWMDVGSWRWSGRGIPGSVVESLTARIEAVVVEHLVTCYGIQDELPTF